MAGSLISGLWRRESSCFHREPTLFPCILHQPARCFMSKIVLFVLRKHALLPISEPLFRQSCCEKLMYLMILIFFAQMRKHGEKKNLVFKPLAGFSQTPNQSNLAESAKVWRGCSENGWMQSQSRPVAQSESQVASRLHFLLFEMDIHLAVRSLPGNPGKYFPVLAFPVSPKFSLFLQSVSAARVSLTSSEEIFSTQAATSPTNISGCRVQRRQYCKHFVKLCHPIVTLKDSLQRIFFRT